MLYSSSHFWSQPVCCVVRVLCISHHFSFVLWLSNCVREFSGGVLERFERVKCFSFPQEGGGSPFTAERSGNTSVTTSDLAPPTDCACPVPVKVGTARWAAGGERCFCKPFLCLFDKCFMSVLCNHLCPWQASDVTTVTTAAVPPGPCPAPALVGKAKPKEITLQWGKHQSWSKTLLWSLSSTSKIYRTLNGGKKKVKIKIWRCFLWA